ncbi:MAG TPA: NAD-glutamate dehydrogenase domain-containing protein, partial [Egibacteraceae bacterium]|nr:NAD-glutamate dehydrogenase domain-containing protein [Egibacteraceae bacterium]
GDVFGSGLLRSESVQLVAAFDHRHVFIDPNPDPEASYAERARLHDLPGSSWSDYDPDLISDGGGVWSRDLKQIPLTEQARRVLRVSDEWLSPPEVIRAILRAPADLLFVGGIGTFVKASGESNDDVGDRANDALRVNADDISARVVAEGGNLAFTQRARIQYARRGGHINIDAIDNSAGVDTSDREVNLKILLDQAIDQGRATHDEAGALLAAMQEDVAERVLRGVYLQTSALRQEAAQSSEAMQAYEALMIALEEDGQLDRVVEVLPSSSQMESRREAGAGLTRPELAVLLSAAKSDLAVRLLASDLPQDPYLAATLRGYFPRLAVERFDDLLDDHRLRRELVATAVANDIVNRMGITYANRTASELGSTRVEIVRAYWAARDVANADALWSGIEELDGEVDPTVQVTLKLGVDQMIDAFTRIYLRQGGVEDIASAVARDQPAFEEMEKSLLEVTSGRRGAARRAEAARLAGIGVHPALADQLASLGELGLVPDVAGVARSSGETVRHVTEVFLRLDEALPLNALHSRLERLTPSGHWQRWQHRGLIDELRDIRRAAAEQALSRSPSASPAEAVDALLAQRAAARERLDTLVRLIEREQEVDLSAVAVAVRALRDLLDA